MIVRPWRECAHTWLNPLLAACLLSVAGPAMGAGKPSRAARRVDTAALTDEVNALLGLQESAIVTLNPGGTADASTRLAVPIEGRTYTLNLVPHSVRSELYEVKAQLADGSYFDIEPGPVHTLRGTVVGIEGSAVAASLSDDGIEARIMLPNDVTYWIEPIGSRVASAALGEHVVYRDDDALPSGGTCTAVDPQTGVVVGANHPGTLRADIGGSVSAAIGGAVCAELAIDADHQYFRRFEGQADPLAATEAQINAIINEMNLQYERDVGIRHVITTIIVRAGGDPARYECAQCSDAGVLLNQFRTQWTTVHLGVPRDVAQLFTGRNLNGSVIGVAFLGGLDCRVTGNAYSVVQMSCCDTLRCKTDLSAHELGHNWGAGHCNCSGWTMNSVLGCNNQFHPTFTIPGILARRDLLTCLDTSGELRRIINTAPATIIAEGTTLQFTAIADFTCGGSRDITSEATWSLDRSDAGSIDFNGLFTAANVDGDACVRVTARYEVNAVSQEKTKTILVKDSIPLALAGSFPPDGAIDARQPSRPDGSFPVGWRSVDMTFTGDTCLMTDGRFTAFGGVTVLPSVDHIEQIGPRTVRIVLARDVEPGGWTTVTHIGSGVGVSIGYLPGDVTGDGIAEPADITALLDAIGGVGAPLPIWSTDIDRSEHFAPADILRAIDLLNGAEAFHAWNLQTLPP